MTRARIRTRANALSQDFIYWTTPTEETPLERGGWVSRPYARDWDRETLRGFLVTMRLKHKDNPAESLLWLNARVVLLSSKHPGALEVRTHQETHGLQVPR